MRYRFVGLVTAFAIGVFWSGAVSADFSDVPSGSKYYEAVSELEDMGIIKSGDKYRPDELMNKAEFYKVMFNYVGYEPKSGEYFTRYEDVEPSAWFAAYVQKAHDLRILQFNPDDKNFYASLPITRTDAMAAALSLFGVPHSKIVSEGELECGGIEADDPRAYLFLAAERYELFDDLKNGVCGPAVRLTRGDAALLVVKLSDLNFESDLKFELSEGGEESAIFEIGDKKLEDGMVKLILNLGKDGKFADNAERFVENKKFSILLDVWDRIHEEYVFQDEIDDEKLLDGAIEGLVDHLGDPYSEFQDADKAEAFTQSINGEFQGIGVSVDIIDGKFTIVSPLKGSPAEKAGLKASDVVLEVDGETTKDVPLEETASRIRGPEGTKVNLKIQRGDSIFNVDVERGVISLEYVESELKDSNVAYLRISSFASDTDERFLEEMEKIVAANPAGLIIDLRNNPGGFLDVTVNILEHFVPKGEKIAYIKTVDGEDEVFESDGDGEFGDLEVIVLMNGGSASASEIMAGTLQDYGIAKLLGTESFGKGTVQQIVSYSDGSQFKYSIANWFTADGRNINKIGLTPDIEVADPQPEGDDIQLQRAIEMLK